jgi:hypothetical protein
MFYTVEDDTGGYRSVAVGKYGRKKIMFFPWRSAIISTWDGVLGGGWGFVLYGEKE